jgi:hypothetical protein
MHKLTLAPIPWIITCMLAISITIAVHAETSVTSSNSVNCNNGKCTEKNKCEINGHSCNTNSNNNNNSTNIKHKDFIPFPDPTTKQQLSYCIHLGVIAMMAYLNEHGFTETSANNAGNVTMNCLQGR